MPSIHKLIQCTALIAVIALAHPAGSAEPAEQELISILKSDAAAKEKAITCKKLAVIGTGDATAALGQLLPDPQLSSWARIALEAITDPSADQVLRDALDQVDGRQLVGVINSIGVRQDTDATAGLTQKLAHSDAQIASAAAVALGHIGTDSARKALETSLATGSAELRSAVAEGCILCAEQLLQNGKATQAAELYEKVRAADVPQQRQLEATRGAILALQSDGLPLLIEQLQSDDQEFFGIGLRTSRELAGEAVTKALVSALEKNTADRQALLMFALSERNDDAVLPVILETAKNGPKTVRPVAVEVLAKAGDVSCVPTLLEIATGADLELAAAAKGALENLADDKVDDEVATRLNSADGPLRLVLIELAGLRRVDAAATLIAAADDSDAKIRHAALAALGSTIGPDELTVLIKRVVSPKHSEDTEAAQRALRAACIRMPDREACAKDLFSAMSRAPIDAKCALLETIGSVGGETALQSVAAAAQGKQPELRDTASQLLGKWMTADAAPVLFVMAKNESENKYRIRALRGYIRIARQFRLPDNERMDMCRKALQLADRDAERKLILQVLERYPNGESLAMAVSAAETPSIKTEATNTALAIARKVGGSDVDMDKLLQQIGQGPIDLKIIKAEYGAGNTFKDVTEVLRKHAGSVPLIVLSSPSYNAALGGDPTPGVVKKLKIQYQVGGKTGQVSLSENSPILLPVPK